jgi:hypothetical protein
MAKNRTSNKDISSIAAKVLAGSEATPEETRSLAAVVLGQVGESKTSSIAAKVMSGNHQATPQETKTLAAIVLGQA